MLMSSCVSQYESEDWGVHRSCTLYWGVRQRCSSRWSPVFDSITIFYGFVSTLSMGYIAA